jgi:HK97 family phage major capsid protein
MPTYEQISNEITDLLARQREIAGIASPSDAETREMWTIEGQVAALTAAKDEAHKAEIAAATRPIQPATAGKSFRDMPKGEDFEVRNALVEGSGSGSYLVPQEWHKSVEEYRFQANRLRSLGIQVIQTNSTHNIPVLSALATAAVTGENVAYTASDPTVAQVILSAYKYTLKTAVSEELLADSAYPVDSMLARATGLAFGAAEEKDMLVGDGSSKITGIFNKTADFTSAGSGVFTTDELVGIVFGLAQQYHDGAVWMMNPATAAAVAKLKEAVTTSGTTPYWWTNAAQGTPATLLGFPVLLNTNITALANSAKAICFGNPKMYALAERGPLVAKRLQLSEYGDTFAFNQRLDGKPMDASAFYVAAAKS